MTESKTLRYNRSNQLLSNGEIWYVERYQKGNDLAGSGVYMRKGGTETIIPLRQIDMTILSGLTGMEAAAQIAMQENDCS